MDSPIIRTLVFGAASEVGEEVSRRLALAGLHLLCVDTDESCLAELDYRLAQSELHRYLAAPSDDIPRVLSWALEASPVGNLVFVGSSWSKNALTCVETLLTELKSPTELGSVVLVDVDLDAENAELSRIRTRELALQFLDKGVRVNSVLCSNLAPCKDPVPRGPRTEAPAPSFPSREPLPTPPLGARASSTEVAQAVLFLLSPLAQLMTAQPLSLDAGELLR